MKIKIAKTSLLIGTLISATFGFASETTPFEPTWDSLKHVNNTPEWFQDAKFGIYTHYGPKSAAFQFMEEDEHLAGWYGMYMYHDRGSLDWDTGESGTPGEPSAHWVYHNDHFGAPSEHGYDQIIRDFNPSAFDAAEWAELFEQSGAKFAGPVAMHHDNFAMWDADSTRWNSVNYSGIDFSKELKREIEKRDMRFMASFHHAFSWKYFAEAHRHGVKEADYDLFTDKHDFMNNEPTERFYREWWAKLKEFIDEYEPDLLWFDWWLENLDEKTRQNFLAYYYNKGLEWDKDVVVTFKECTFPEFSAVRDYERGRPNMPIEQTWLTDTSPGAWFYRPNAEFATPNELVDILIDIVSKNGCMLLNVPPDPDGSIPEEMQELLKAIGGWLKVNGDSIYKTRPWKIFGEGPTRIAKGGHKIEERGPIHYTESDIRFTKANEHEFYAIVMDTPKHEIEIYSLGAKLGVLNLDIESIELLGSDEPIYWARTQNALVIQKPNEFPTEFAHAFKIKIESYQERDIAGE